MISRILLCSICEERGFDFAATHGKSPCFSEFERWLLSYDFDTIINQKPPENTPETYSTQERNAIHTHFLNLFTSAICSDLQNGLLTLQPYKETKRAKRQKETALMHKYGIKRKTAARLPKNIRAGFVELGLQPVK
jgi:hypothetical protein